VDYLVPLGFGMEEEGEDQFCVAIPSFRATKDVSIEEDLIEELGRCYGYDNITPVAPLVPVTVPFKEPELVLNHKLKHIFAHDNDALEAKNYTFLADEHVERLGLEDLPYLRVTNAIASHLSRIQRDVMPGLLISLADNLRREKFVSLFEIDKGYHPDVRGEILERDGQTRSLPFEVLQLVHVVADRNLGSEHPYHRVRGHLEHALKCVGRPHLETIQLEAPPPWMHPGRTAAFVAPADHGRVVAYVGDLHPKTVERLGLDLPKKGGGAAALAIDMRQLLAVPRQEIAYRSKPRFQDQPVDLAILAPNDVHVAQLTQVLASANPKILREVKLFEVYRGQGLPKGKRSLNFTVVLGSDKRTLTTADEERFIQRVRDLVAEIGCELRG
jgi:phenylalanyl-tRNA synthetase beta chain